MRFLIDENVEYRVATFLTAQGHDVAAIAHDLPHALPDDDVLAIAVRERRILITNDRDFGDLIFRQRRRHSGVIYFRLSLASTVEDKIVRLRDVLQDHSADLDQFLVVSERAVRVRRQ